MYTLKEGQEIAVDQGNLVAYESTVDFDIETIAGPFNWLFGGEGIFFGKLKGPGKVWLQTRKYILGRPMGQNQQNSMIPRITTTIISFLIFGCFFVFAIISFLEK